jgi:glycosyltransferase involved in cell wall biosynthesis
VDEGFARFIDEAAGKIKERIHLPGIIQPNDLPAFAARFDVGLATEKATPLNRNICLTNKIFTYLLAGNCILASDTDAQKGFLYSYKQVGLLYKNEDIKDLAQKIDFLFKDRSFLNNCKESSFALALKELNWENESKKLLRQVSSLF